jgi:phosphatidate cytidylyltransferase
MLSSAVLVPVAVYVIIRGGWWYLGFALVLVTVATWEYVRMLRRLSYGSPYVFAMGLACAVLVTFYLSTPSYLQLAVAGLLLISLAWHILSDPSRTMLENWLLPLAGALYIGWFAGHSILLRALPRGAVRLLGVVAINICADVGAYFVGRAWGKRPLLPRWSPKKTWEGLAGGVGAAIVGGGLFYGLGGIGWVHGVILGLLLSTLSPFGDLGVSMIKRRAGVKDSSHLIPGHGGVLDRLDSMLVSVVVGYYYQALTIGAFPAS